MTFGQGGKLNFVAHETDLRHWLKCGLMKRQWPEFAATWRRTALEMLHFHKRMF